ALIDNITKPGVEIQQAMTSVRAQVNEETRKSQLPWGHTNLTGSVYLNQAPTTQVANAAPTASGIVPGASSSSDGVELEYWRSVKESNKPEELNAYLSAYPNGQFKALALARLAAIKSGTSTATRTLNAGVDPATFTDEATQLTEDQIGLNKTQRRDVQRRLTSLGFDTKQTGVFSEETRAVLRRWQAARGYPSSGYLNKHQHKALLSEIMAAPATASDTSQKPARRASAPPPSSAPAPAPHRSNPGDAAGAAFVGGVVGGMMGGMFRR
ncbi:MAG: peptidoglycan-binding domain-containing protein, partial [Pseudomonadota bacterium]